MNGFEAHEHTALATRTVDLKHLKDLKDPTHLTHLTHLTDLPFVLPCR